MKINKLIIVFLVLVFVQASAFCADYLYKKLPSGHNIIIYENKDNPIVTINTWVKTGSINEDNDNSGVAHFLEHLFFKGSKNVPTGEFDKILEAKGAITNAATSKDYTQFYITIPSKDFNTALKLHSDMLLNPLIPDSELEKERHVVIEEISRGLDNPTNIMYNNLFKLIYSSSNHPYMRPVIGTKEIISSIKREKILEFYNKWYIPSNMITVVSGDINKNEALKQVSEAFSKETSAQMTKTYPKIQDITSQIKINEEKDVAKGYMMIAYKTPKAADIKDAYALDILSVILGGSTSSILNTSIKEKKQLANSISASYSQYLDDGLFIIISTFDPNKISLVKNNIFDEIEKTKKDGITKAQVQKAKNILRSSANYSRESSANIAEELGYFTLYYGTPKLYDTYLKKIDSINVDDVNHVLNKYLINNKTAISTVMPKGFVEISNYSAAAKIIPDSANLVEETEKEKKYILDNGATLIVRKNKQNSIIGISILAKGGIFLEKKIGSAYLAANSAKRGTENYNFEELSNYLDENGIKLGLSQGQDAFNVSLISTKQKFNDALNILDEVINKPTFPTSEIQKVKKEYKNYVNAMKDRPLSLALDEFTHLAYKGYPYSNTSSVLIKNIDDIQREDIVDYYNNVFDSKNLIISVSGDVDTNYLIKEFNKIFKDKKNPEIEIKKYYKNSYIPNENITKKITSSDKETSWIVVGYKTCPIYNIKEVATLRVIDSLLGTGMSSRMFQHLREEKGLAYQVGTQIHQYGNDGAIFGYIGTNSKNEQIALKSIIGEFEKLKTDFVSAVELQEAKDKLTGNMILALETNFEKAAFSSKYNLYGYDLNFLDKLNEEINNVTVSDIISFANKYFSNPHFEIIVGK